MNAPVNPDPIPVADQHALLGVLARICAGDSIAGLGESIADFTGMAEAEAHNAAALFFRLVRDHRSNTRTS